MALLFAPIWKSLKAARHSYYSLVPRPKQLQRGSLEVSFAGKDGLVSQAGVMRIFGMLTFSFTCQHGPYS